MFLRIFIPFLVYGIFLSISLSIVVVNIQARKEAKDKKKKVLDMIKYN